MQVKPVAGSFGTFFFLQKKILSALMLWEFSTCDKYGFTIPFITDAYMYTF